MARPSPEELFRRAELFAKHAKREASSSDPADWQNAAGKGWQAARMAAEAALVCQGFKRPKGTRTLLIEIRKLGKLSAFADFAQNVQVAYSDLHLSCGEDGDCDRHSRRIAENVGNDVVNLARRVCGR